MTRALVTQLLEALDESRGDVSQCLQEELPKAGYERYDRRIKAITEQLEKHDAAIKAAREYLATEPKPTLKEALTQQGIKLRTEFEPKQWDGDRSHLRFGGCPACGKRSCIARSCTTNEPTTRPLTLQERAEMESAGVTGELVKVLAFNDRPKAEPSGERAELANEIRSTANHLSRYDTPGFPMNPFAAVCHKAADMLEADAQRAKRVPMTEKQIDKIHANTARLAQIRTTFFIAFARAIEAHHGITPADKPTVDEPEEDLYALALKADNWGQP